MTSVYIAIGSNLSDPATQLQLATHALSALPHSEIDAISSVYQSAAVGPGEQPDYLNAVVKLTSTLPAEQVLESTQAIEDNQGRLRNQRWGPRTLDLDILLYDCEVISTDNLQVPHPRLSERNFVLYPLLEVAEPQLTLPDGRSLDTLLANCPLDDLVRTGIILSQNYHSTSPRHGINAR